MQHDADQLVIIEQLVAILGDSSMSQKLAPNLKDEAVWWIRTKINDLVATLPDKDPVKQHSLKLLDSLNHTQSTLEPILETSFENLATTEDRFKNRGSSPEIETVKKNCLAKRCRTDTDIDSFITKSTAKNSKYLTKSPMMTKSVKIDDVPSLNQETHYVVSLAEKEMGQLFEQRDQLAKQVQHLRQNLQELKKHSSNQMINAKLLGNQSDLFKKQTSVNNENEYQQIDRGGNDRKKQLMDLRAEVQRLRIQNDNSKNILIQLNDNVTTETNFIQAYSQILEVLQQESKLQSKEKQSLKQHLQQVQKQAQILHQKLEVMVQMITYIKSQTKKNIMQQVQNQLNMFK